MADGIEDDRRGRTTDANDILEEVDDATAVTKEVETMIRTSTEHQMTQTDLTSTAIDAEKRTIYNLNRQLRRRDEKIKCLESFVSRLKSKGFMDSALHDHIMEKFGGSSKRITTHGIDTSDDVCAKGEVMDQYVMVDDLMVEDDGLKVEDVDPLSDISTIKGEPCTQECAQNRSTIRLPEQVTGPPGAVSVVVKEEWIDDIRMEDIKKEEVTDSYHYDSSSIKEQADITTNTGPETCGSSTDVTQVKQDSIDDVVLKVEKDNDSFTGVVAEFPRCCSEAFMEEKVCESAKSYSCYTCEQTFCRKANLRRHMRIHTEGMPYACDFCDSRFGRAVYLKKHIMVHTGERPFKCEVCGTTFIRYDSLVAHKRTHSGEKLNYACDVCGTRFSRTGNLKNHMKVHTGEKPYACDVCGARYSQASDWKRHVIKHSEQKPYTCYVCETKFTEARSLKDHMVTHTGEKRYACEVCGNRFAHAGVLRKHKLTHTGEKRYACDICGYKFSRASQLKNHINAGEEPHACDVCGKSFSQHCVLKKHVMTHTAERPYACDICEARFPLPGNLNRHKLIHTGEKPHACDNCGARFIRAGHLKRHITIHAKEKC